MSFLRHLMSNKGVPLKSGLTSRSLKMAPFDRSHTHTHPITLPLSVNLGPWTTFKALEAEYIVTLKSWYGVTYTVNLCTICASLNSTDPEWLRSIFIQFHTASLKKVIHALRSFKVIQIASDEFHPTFSSTNKIVNTLQHQSIGTKSKK